MSSPYGTHGLATASGDEAPLHGISPQPSSTSDIKNPKVQDPQDLQVYFFVNELYVPYHAFHVICSFVTTSLAHLLNNLSQYFTLNYVIA
jgi:hypothetical protein